VFGKHARLERELRQQGRAALATVLSARVRLPAPTLTTRINLGPMRQGNLGPSLWKMAACGGVVYGPPLTAGCRVLANCFHPPSVCLSETEGAIKALLVACRMRGRGLIDRRGGALLDEREFSHFPM
jgi:hypothetical protein